MRFKYLAFLIVAFVLSVSCLNAADISRLKSIYEKSLTQIDSSYSDMELSAGISYVNDLKRLQKAVQNKGNLEGWKTVQKEIDRYKRDRKLAPENYVSSLPELETLQKKHTLALKEAPIKKSRAVMQLYEKYLARLDKEQVELTKKGKIDDALKVNAEIKRLKASDRIVDARKNIEAFEALAGGDAGPQDEAPGEPKDPGEQADEVKMPEIEEINGCVVYNGKKPPRKKGILYRTFSCRPTPLARLEKKLSLSIQHASSSESDSTHTEYSSSRSASKNDYIRLTMRATGEDQERLRVYVQYFAKPVGKSRGKLVPQQVKSIKVPIKKLSSEYVYVDFPAVCTSSASSSYHYSIYSSSSSTSKSGQEFYGVVASVFNDEGQPIFQSAGPPTLDKMGLKEVSNLKQLEADVKTERANVERLSADYQAASSAYWRDTNNLENRRKYESSRDVYYAAKRRLAEIEAELSGSR